MDLIDRQAAIDAVNEIDDGDNMDISTNEVRNYYVKRHPQSQRQAVLNKSFMVRRQKNNMNLYTGCCLNRHLIIQIQDSELSNGWEEKRMLKFILGMIVGASIGFLMACLVRANDD